MPDQQPDSHRTPASIADAGVEVPGVGVGSSWGGTAPSLGRLYLVGTVFMIAYMVWAVLTSAMTWPWVALGLACVVLFGTLTWSRFRIDPRDRGWEGWVPVTVVAMMVAISSAIVVFNEQGTGIGLFYFAAIGCAFIRPDRWAIRAIAIVSTIAGLSWGVRHPALDAIPLAVQIGFIALAVYGMGVLRRTNRQLLAARHDLARLAVAEERLRISRDLHDTLGHSLTLIALKTELIERLLPDDPARAQAEANDAGRAAREALASVRETVSAYRQPTLDSELAGVQRALDAAGVETRVELLTPPATTASSTLLAWAIREGGTNVLRHSGARHATIRVGTDAGLAFAEIVDDGVGRAAEASAPTGRGGSGLTGLAERVARHGGQLEAGPRPEGGYRLRVTVPLEAGA